MRRTARILGAAALTVGLCTTGAPLAQAQGYHGDHLARQVLPARDGWASYDGGTTGGAAATQDNIFVVHTQAELQAAVTGDEPKIVYVRGDIDANTDEQGDPISCADYARDGYTLANYLATYAPEVWGRDSEPSGPVEDARHASQLAQAAQIEVHVGSNTTLIGEPGSSITGAAIELENVSNVIIRGLTISDAHDCFPSWDPTDGSSGNWNSEYDTIGLKGATHVWIDHNDLSDGDNPDSSQPTYFGRPYQVHDGLLDITNASDLVTVSYNRLHDHDKTMLIGSSDSRTTDRGHLRVTLDHNEFRNLGQRVPRVRYGQVDSYNNHYVVDAAGAGTYIYSLGVGVESHIVAQHNAFTLAAGVDRGTVIGNYKGTQITVGDNLVNGRPIDLLAAYNAEADPAKQIDAVPPFAPLLRRHVVSAHAVARLVDHKAGPEHLHRGGHHRR